MQQKNPLGKTGILTRTALYAAVICIIGPITVPIGFSPVPISIFSLAVYLFAYCLSPSELTVGTAVYLLLGAFGLPVFSGTAGGLGHLLGPTGGYLVGYLMLAYLCAWFDRRFSKSGWMQFLGMLLATAALFLIGTIWYMQVTQSTFGAAVTLCVLPYLPFDLCKILAAVSVGPMIAKRLEAQKRIR